MSYKEVAARLQVFAPVLLLLFGVRLVSAQSNRPPNVPLPGNAIRSSASLPDPVTEAVVHAAESKVRPHALAIGERAPEFQLKDVDGHVVKLSDYKGKVVLLNFWAMWCGHCIDELPALVELERKYKDRGLEIIGVTNDDFQRLYQGKLPPDPALKAKLKGFSAAKHMNYPIVMETAAIAESYSIPGFPTSYLIDRNGLVRATTAGEWDLATAEKEVGPLLNK